MRAKFGDSRFSRSKENKEIIGAPKFKMGHVTLTTHILRAICHSYAET